MHLQSSSSFRSFGPADGVLALLAVIGLFAYVFLLPSVHIDSTGSYALTESEAIERANIYLVSQGYHIENLDISATLIRNERLLNSMQADLGRKRTLEILKNEPGSRLPDFMWSVRYRMEDLETVSTFSVVPVARAFNVRLTETGEVVAFSNTTADLGAAAASVGSPTQTVNRTVLSKLFSDSDSLEIDALRRLRALTDSVLISGLRFARSDNGGARPRPFSGTRHDRLTQLENGRPVLLDSLDLLFMARTHAPSDAFVGVEWRLDSLRIFQERPARLAQVRLLTSTPVENQEFRLDITLTSTGNVQAMDMVSNPDRESSSVTADVLGGISLGGYVVIFIYLLVLFVRRIMARLIDVKGSMLDALVFGVLVGLSVILRKDIGIESELTGWARIGASLLIFSITGGATALFVFIVASASESATREVLPEKLHSSMLLRRGDMHNQLIGWSILRGIGMAGLLLGVGILSFALMPAMPAEISAALDIEQSIRPVATNTAVGLSFSYIILLFLFLGVGTLFYRVSPKPWLTVLAVTVTGGLLQIAPFGLAISWSAIGVSALVAFLLALAYVRYDFLTIVVAFFVAGFAWHLSEGFLIVDSPGWLDTLLGTLIIISLALYGFVGVLSRRTGGDASQYVPEYISELAGQERIKRELEIAYQVQASFLPRTMPNVSGLDLAGMCLPANEVGGDYFDFIRLPDGRLAFVVGDVSGKGIQAAFYMTLVKGVIQTLSTTLASPQTIMFRLNEVFRRNAPAGTFISAIYGIADPVSGVFTFARAGHNPAILKRAASDTPEFLCPTGMAIGFTDGLVFENSIEEVSIELAPGDALVFYTDGFSEAMNSKRELYGDDRLFNKVGHVGSRSASGILRTLTEDVHHFIESSGRSDDMTMVVVKRSVQ